MYITIFVTVDKNNNLLANKCDVSVEFHAISSMLRVSKAS